MKPEDNTEGLDRIWPAETIDAAEDYYGHYPTDEELESFEEMHDNFGKENV